MPRYLIRPRHPESVDALSFVARTAGKGQRTDRLDNVLRIRADNPGQQEIERYLADVQQRHPVRLLSKDSQPVTGTRIIETSEEVAETIGNELRDAIVLADRPVDLIQPRRNPNRKTASVADDQLWHLTAIGLKEARNRGITRDGNGVIVAVLDTGIDGTVPELEGRVVGAFQTNVAEWRMDSQSLSRDTIEHGTHVAGLICGKKVGVAPGAQVINCTIIPNGQGNLSNFILAIEWAARRDDIQIVNISAGIPGYLPEMEDAVYGLLAAGILPVVAIGNEGRNRTRSPGNYRDVLSVGASNKRYTVSRFSGSGNIINGAQMYSKPDLVAPGESVYSCVPGGAYEAWDGTSMAAPIVSGIACLAIERDSSMGVLNLIEAILEACRDLHFLKDRQGMGLVQII